MDWKDLWIALFGTTDWLGLDIGFWVGMATVVLVVVAMNVVFWSLPPKRD